MEGGYFESQYGLIRPRWWRRYWKILKFLDMVYNFRVSSAYRQASIAAKSESPQKILIAAVEVPGREIQLKNLIYKMQYQTIHDVTTSVVPMNPVGKFDNINIALKNKNILDFDWLLIIDDDIEVPHGILDLLVYLSRAQDLKIAQPAHRFLSYASFSVTERHWGTMVRRTAFVEIGPISLLHRDTLQYLTPFPSLRWAWGLDIYWSATAKRQGWRLGVIDCVPISHTRPVGKSYDTAPAKSEAIAFLKSEKIDMNWNEIFGTSERLL